MASPAVLEAADLLLRAMQCKVGDDGYYSSFMFGRPDKPWARNFGTTVFYSRKRMIHATLFVRKHGAAHLAHMSVANVRSILTKFVADNYWCLSDETLFRQFPACYADHISERLKYRFADALASSENFLPSTSTMLFPLVPVLVTSEFEFDTFFLCNPGSLATYVPTRWRGSLAAGSFPPTKEWDGKRHVPSSWLGIRAPSDAIARKMAAAVLGAIALTPAARYRYQFSMRKMFGGTCTIDDRLSVLFRDEPNTPPLSENIAINSDDNRWLNTLAQKLTASDPTSRREITSLEYFYKAWPLDEPERFAWLCMALDALFSERGKVTRTVLEGVQCVLGDHISEQRLRALLDVRGSVVHGRSPNVFECEEYEYYYRQYEDNPVYDMGLIVAECLRKKVFGNDLAERPNPNASLVAVMQAKGRLPPNMFSDTILGPPPNRK